MLRNFVSKTHFFEKFLEIGKNIKTQKKNNSAFISVFLFFWLGTNISPVTPVTPVTPHKTWHYHTNISIYTYMKLYLMCIYLCKSPKCYGCYTCLCVACYSKAVGVTLFKYRCHPLFSKPNFALALPKPYLLYLCIHAFLGLFRSSLYQQ